MAESLLKDIPGFTKEKIELNKLRLEKIYKSI